MAYAPAGTTTQTPTLQHLATVYYEKMGLDRLTALFRFHTIGEPHPLPQGSGKTLQMYRFALPGFNTTPAAEGVIGSPVQQASSTISVTVEQYSDFMSASALLEETDINNTNNQMVEDLSYRAAGTVDTIYRLEVDSASTPQVSTIGAYLSAADFKANVAKLLGINVLPRMDNTFLSVLHPYVVYDVISDNTAGGFIDSMKYASGRQVLNGEVGEVGMCRLLTSTNVGTTGSGASLQYYTYIFGKGAFGVCDLQGRGPSGVTDPKNERFQIATIKGGPSPSDPVGEIAYYASYRFVTAAKILDAVNYRYYVVKSDASLV